MADIITIEVIENIDNVQIGVTEQNIPVDIQVNENIDNIQIAVSETIEQVSIQVIENIDVVEINVIESTGGGAVDSVNGETGVVVLTTGDISEDTDFNYISDAEKVVVQNTSNTNTGDQDLSGKEDVGVAQGIMDTHEANHPVPTNRDARNQIAGSYEPLKGADDNYVTDAEKIVIGNTSGTNTGDQDISGIATNAGDITIIEGEQTTQNTAIDLNTAKTGITSQQATDITTNNAKNTNVSTNLSEGTATEITVDVNSSDGTNATLAAASTIRAGVLTKAKFDEVEVNNAKTGITAQQSSDITTNNAKNSYPTADETKLSGIETNAEVNNISDADATDLTDAGDSALHHHSTDRDRANHTGTQTLSTISDSGDLAALNTVDTAQIDDAAVSIAKLDVGGTPSTQYIIVYQPFAPTNWVWVENPGDHSHYIRLTLSGVNTFSQTAGTATVIPWNVETFKDSTYFTHDNVTNPERIVFNVAGTYSIQWNLSFTHVGSANFFIASPRYARIGPPVNQKRGITKSFGYNTYEGTISQYSEVTAAAGFYLVMYIDINTSSDVGSDTIINDESEVIVRRII